MLEEMFIGLKVKEKDDEPLKGAIRVLRFYQLLRLCGLRIRDGQYAGCNFNFGRTGGRATIDIPDGLYLLFSVFIGEHSNMEFEISTPETDDGIRLFHDGASWALSYTPDDRVPNAQIQRLADRFGLEADGDKATAIDHLRLRGFLREVSLLTIRQPIADLVAPA